MAVRLGSSARAIIAPGRREKAGVRSQNQNRSTDFADATEVAEVEVAMANAVIAEIATKAVLLTPDT